MPEPLQTGLRIVDNGDPPLEQLVECADREAHADEEEPQPPAARQPGGAKQQLTANERRRESLHEVTDAIEVVAGQIESIAHPIPDGHFRVRVSRANGENEVVDDDHGVDDARKAKSPVRRQQHNDADEAE